MKNSNLLPCGMFQNLNASVCCITKTFRVDIFGKNTLGGSHMLISHQKIPKSGGLTVNDVELFGEGGVGSISPL